jgi:hypothetical protein
MLNDFGEGKVTVKKDELLTAIRKNREEHRGMFLEAQKGYRESVIEELDKMLADARTGKDYRVFVGLTAPSDHTKDYDRVIHMLEMSTADEVSVTERQFSQFVLDEWGWKGDFVATSANYINKR